MRRGREGSQERSKEWLIQLGKKLEGRRGQLVELRVSEVWGTVGKRTESLVRKEKRVGEGGLFGENEMSIHRGGGF